VSLSGTELLVLRFEPQWIVQLKTWKVF